MCLQKNSSPDEVSSNNFVLNNRLLAQRSAQRDFIMFIFTEPLRNPSRALRISARALTGGVVLDSRANKYFSINIREIYARKLSTQDDFSFHFFSSATLLEANRGETNKGKVQICCPAMSKQSFRIHRKSRFD